MLFFANFLLAATLQM